MSVFGNRQLYWYKIIFSGAPTLIEVMSCRVVRAIQEMTNKWDSVFRNVLGAFFYDASALSYNDKLGAVTDGVSSTTMDIGSMTTSDYIYIKTLEPALGFGFLLGEGAVNSNNAEVDLIECIGPTGWVSVGTFRDETLDTAADSSFANSGVIWLDEEHEPQLSIFQGDRALGYWYRISIDAALSANPEITEIVYASWPKTLRPVKGCVEFNGQLILWGESRYPNRLIVSPYNRPDQLCNIEERYSIPFGSEEPIKCCLVLGDNLAVLKESGFYLVASDLTTMTKATQDVGIAGAKTAVVIESGDKTLKEDELLSILK
jgi:hypothetical protein